MHAAFYNSEDLQNADWLDPPTTKESASQSRQFFQTVLPGWIARYPGRVSAEMEAFLVRFANNFDKWMMDINNAPKMLRVGVYAAIGGPQYLTFPSARGFSDRQSFVPILRRRRSRLERHGRLADLRRFQRGF